MKINRLKVLGTLLAVTISLTACGSPKKDNNSAQEKVPETTQTPETTNDENSKIPSANESKSTENTYTPGNLTAEYYESEWLGLRFTPPENVSLITKGQMDINMNAGSDILKENLGEDIVNQAVQNTVYEMMAVQEGGFPNVSVAVEDVSKVSVDESTYLNLLKQNLDAAELGYSYGEVSERQIAGQVYRTMDTSVFTNGVDMLQTFYLRKMEDKFVVITLSFTTDTKAQGDTIMNSFTALN